MKKSNRPAAAFTALIVIFVPFFLCSCVGVKADINLSSGGSGTIALEYRLSRLLESIGKQDGNERWLPVPVGKADFERSISRLPGMKLLSFSSKYDEKDLVVNVKLEFADMETLARFLDPSGEKAVYEEAAAGETNTLLLNLGAGPGGGVPSNRPLAELFGDVSEGYSVSINMSVPGEGKLDAPSFPGGTLNAAGKNLMFSAPLGALLSSGENAVLKFNW